MLIPVGTPGPLPSFGQTSISPSASLNRPNLEFGFISCTLSAGSDPPPTFNRIRKPGILVQIVG